MASRWALLGLAALLATGLANAQDEGRWELQPSVHAGVTFSDNISLDRRGAERDDIFYEVTPGVVLKRNGERLQLDLNYRLQSLTYQDSDESNEVAHYLRGRMQSELLSKHLFLDINSNISQQILDPETRFGFSVGNTTGNRSEVRTLSANPYWTSQLGKFTELRLSYSAGVVEYDDPSAEDNESQGWSAIVASAPTNSPFSWGAQVDNNNVDYDTGEEVEFERMSVNVGYRVGPRLTLIASGGEDSNLLSGATTSNVIDGSFWSAGVRGQYDDKTSFELRFGEQFFGDSFYASVERQLRRLSFQVQYNEAATTQGLRQLDYDNLLGFLSEITGLDITQEAPDIYVSKRFTANASLQFTRSSVSLTGYNEDREYLRTSSAGNDDGIIGAIAAFEWRVDDRTKVDADVNFQKHDLRSRDQAPNDIRIQLRATRAVLDASELSLRVWRTRRSAARAGDEYTENGVSVGIRTNF